MARGGGRLHGGGIRCREVCGMISHGSWRVVWQVGGVVSRRQRLLWRGGRGIRRGRGMLQFLGRSVVVDCSGVCRLAGVGRRVWRRRGRVVVGGVGVIGAAHGSVGRCVRRRHDACRAGRAAPLAGRSRGCLAVRSLHLSRRGGEFSRGRGVSLEAGGSWCTSATGRAPPSRSGRQRRAQAWCYERCERGAVWREW